MTESVLKSIMRMFAIFGNLRFSADSNYGEDNYIHTREITEAFLTQLINPDQSSKYIQMFDFHFRNLQRRKIVKSVKRAALFSVKTLLICEQINNHLDLKQKVFVVLQLFDILKSSDTKMHPETEDFIITIADSLGISSDDYDLMHFFVYSPLTDKLHNSSFMIVSGLANESVFRHHLFRDNMSGTIVVFYLPSTKTYFFRHEEVDDWLYINGKSVIFNRIYLLEKGTAIRCPKIQTIHYGDIIGNFLHMKVQHEVQLTGLDIEFGFKNSDNGIKKFNFQAKAGQLVGIMGGSGVGKSTLLNILNGTLKPDSGRVLINGIDIYENRDKTKGIIGFIPQDDFLVEELTVFENLYFNARFCFSNLSENETINLVDKLLKELNLYEIRDLTVGTPLNKFISGGQRKRLNIALELLREPYILFVDEPTSGLSSNDSDKVMELLKRQTFNGKLVIVNIHQPSSDIFKLFDSLLVLDKGGRPVYYGNAVDSLVYFKTATQLVNASESECVWCGNLNPEQLLQIIETSAIDENGQITDQRMVAPEDWYQLYLSTIETSLNIRPLTKPLPKTGFNLPGRFKQFLLYFLRNLKCKIADKQYLFVNILEAPALAFILSFFTYYSGGQNGTYIFSENVNIPAFLFMSIVVALFLGMMGSAEEINKDAKLLKREGFLNLNRFSYINSKVLYLFGVSAFQMLVYVIISLYILKIRNMYVEYWLILFTTSCFANMMGLNLSAGLRSLVAIYILIPLLLIPQLLLSGVIVKFDKLHTFLKSEIYVPAIGDIMASRWAYEALAVEQFRKNRYENMFYNFEKAESNSTFCTNYLIPELLNRVSICEAYLDMPEQTTNLKNQLLLIRFEMKDLAKQLQVSIFEKEELLSPGNFNPDLAKEVSKYLRHARSISSKILKRSIDAKDERLMQIENRLNGHLNLVNLKEKYHNASLADQLLNKNEAEKIIELNGRLYRKYEPVFNIPDSKYGRAHFYAPYKQLGNYLFDTLWFNLAVIWLMSILLYITLSFNVLGKIVDSLSLREK
jgi:ABC transport system ATP-binding/permease protein